MEALFEQFIREKQYLANVSKHTVDGYRWAWKALAAALEGQSSVVKDSVIQRIAEMRAAGLTAVTINTYLRTLNTSVAGCIQKGMRPAS